MDYGPAFQDVSHGHMRGSRGLWGGGQGSSSCYEVAVNSCESPLVR